MEERFQSWNFGNLIDGIFTRKYICERRDGVEKSFGGFRDFITMNLRVRISTFKLFMKGITTQWILSQKSIILLKGDLTV
jgi:hypothetical protein